MCVMFGINISIRTMSFYIIFDLNESSSHKSISKNLFLGHLKH